MHYRHRSSGFRENKLSKLLNDCGCRSSVATKSRNYVNTHGVKHDQLPPATNGVVTNFFFEIVNQYLVGKISVVIEAAFQHKVWEPWMPKILEGAPFIVVCSVDGMVAAKRHLQRGLADPNREFYHGISVLNLQENWCNVAS